MSIHQLLLFLETVAREHDINDRYFFKAFESGRQITSMEGINGLLFLLLLLLLFLFLLCEAHIDVVETRDELFMIYAW